MKQTSQQTQDLLNFIDSSPSPFHAVDSIKQRLLSNGFSVLDETEKWLLKPGGSYVVIRDDSSIVFFVLGTKPLVKSGIKIIGAHTDSPGLKIKPQPIIHSDGLLRLGVEVYGGPVLATFSDRDLSLAGRVSYKNEAGMIVSQLVHFEQALLRLPNLAIHMNRKVNEEGLKFNKQTELAVILSDSVEQQVSAAYLKQLLASHCEIKLEQLLSWELNVYDTQKGCFWGAEQQFYSNSQLDNLASCHAGLEALLDEKTLSSGNTVMAAFFDHEEIGSESSKGASGCFLSDVLQRMTYAVELSDEDYRRTLAQSFMISADMAHAYQPNFPSAYEPEHKVNVNQGPVIKINSNQRYSTESVSEALFMHWCELSGVPFQKYSHRTDIPCGSTIGPMSSARLGIRTIDVGNPMWAMHSIRESAGVEDHGFLIKALTTFFAE